jgi:tetratricopeptide (TPR) repeat protein
MILAAVVGGTTLVGAAQAQGLAGSYLAARQAGMAADFEAAADYYTRALARDPGNPALLEYATHAQLALGRLDRGVPIARRLDAEGLSSQIANMVLLADAASKEDFETLVQRHEDGKGVGPLVDGLVLAWALLGQGKVSEAIDAFDRVASERGLGGFANYHKGLALALVGDFEAAETLMSDPATGGLSLTRRGVVAHLEILSQLDRTDEALELLSAQFGRDLDPELRGLQERLEAGKTLPFTTLASAGDGIAEVFYTVAAALSNEAEADYSILYSRVAEYLQPSHTEALLLSASLLDELRLYDLAVDTYSRIAPEDPSFHAAELGRADALRRGGRIEDAAAVLTALTASHGDLPMVHVTLGDLRRQSKDFDAAVRAYDAALALYEDETPAQWFVYYARAISFERLDRWEQAEADFRKALDLNPDHPQVLNYLGYSLVEKRMKLDEALSMIERAVDARPNSGHIVDSLGWVLYRLGRYEDAVPHMERAAELMPVDPVVNDHLGDVLWAVGRYREAEFQWKRALSFIDPDDVPTDISPDRVRQKLAEGLDAVLEQEGAAPLQTVKAAE